MSKIIMDKKALENFLMLIKGRIDVLNINISKEDRIMIDLELIDSLKDFISSELIEEFELVKTGLDKEEFKSELSKLLYNKDNIEFIKDVEIIEN